MRYRRAVAMCPKADCVVVVAYFYHLCPERHFEDPGKSATDQSFLQNIALAS